MNVVVTQDAIPPVVELLTPAVLSGITSGKVTALASDNLGLSEVVFRVDGVEKARFPGPPYELALTRPEGCAPQKLHPARKLIGGTRSLVFAPGSLLLLGRG